MEMSKSSKPNHSNSPQARDMPGGGGYKDRDLAGMSPEECQEMCKPTADMPMPMHTKMAGAK